MREVGGNDKADGVPTVGPLPSVPTCITAYLVFLLVYTSLAGFFDGFTTSFRYAMITYVREDYGVSFGGMARMFTWVYLGSCLAIVPRALADIIGRKIMLWATVVGLCTLQWLIGFARNVEEYFVLLAVLAVLYRSDIWALVLSEEAPPRRRALLVGVAHAVAGLGAFVLGMLVSQMSDAPGAWRSVTRFTLAGAFLSIPFFLAMRETRHFQAQRMCRAKRPGLGVLLAPFRRTLLKPLVVLSVLKMLFGGGAMVTIALLGTEYLRVVHGFEAHVVGRVIQAETVGGMVAWLIAGPLADRFGRHSCVYLFGMVYVTALLLMALLPNGSSGVPVAAVLQHSAAIGIFGILRVTTMEVFPNDCRATGSAITDLTTVLFAAGTAGVLGRLTEGIGSGAAGLPLASCILGVAVGVVLVLPLFRLLPETRGRRLEEV